MHFGLIGRIDLAQTIDFGLVLGPGWIGRIVAKRRVLDKLRDNVDSKSVDSSPQPEAQHVVHRRAHIRVSPVQVRLFGEKGVIVILARAFIPCPGAAAKIADPIVRRTAVRGRRPARYTSRASDRRATAGSRRTRDARSTYGWGQSRE